MPDFANAYQGCINFESSDSFSTDSFFRKTIPYSNYTFCKAKIPNIQLSSLLIQFVAMAPGPGYDEHGLLDWES